mmetsp:Transcript_52540/g.122213  ORF Transcript_52540/g.122213 Transcript_52540/m.122213 type:complete len:222 (+) Transcript_52540:263-928(+)
MPDSTIASMQSFHFTGFVICMHMSSAILEGSVSQSTAVADTFMKTLQRGRFMRGKTSPSLAISRCRAGSISGVWKAPEDLMRRACKARAPSASFWHSSTATLVPATVKPLGKSTFEIWQISLPSGCIRNTSWQRPCNLAGSSPATESMACGRWFVASSMASARSFTKANPSAKVRTPAAQSAVYSPKERPAMAYGLRTASGFCTRNFSSPARPATNMAGWQ